ncbi:MAG: hypothetical protein HN909_04590 [Phycisphaerales bacterium]|jgi:hypothetical protein|nr:hypothetical protein [Phycisphaerales bacterium]MBT7171029.1 hypothetical protein [Phycisphaerales bacterium]
MKCKSILTLFIVFAVGTAILSGCGGKKTADPATPAVANTICPIMGGNVTANASGENYRVFQAKGVGFCCPGCSDKWDALSDAEKVEKLKAIE